MKIDWVTPCPASIYFELIRVMKAHLEVRYPGKVVTIELNEVDVPIGCTVFGIGEHGFVRYRLDYQNYNLDECKESK